MRFCLSLGLSRRAAACTVTASLLAGAAHAAPQGDDIGQFLNERGLVEQIQQAGAAVRDRASSLVANAMLFLGVPYKRGGNTVDSGFDCSGFVRAVYEQSVGLLLPRKASEQAAATTPIDKTELQPGDLVFFDTLKAAFSHVGIYVGDGKFVHSPRSGAQVRVEDMRVSYWQNRFNGARRVTGGPAPTTTPALASPAADTAPGAAAMFIGER